jgi:hypothetical protein
MRTDLSASERKKTVIQLTLVRLQASLRSDRPCAASVAMAEVVETGDISRSPDRLQSAALGNAPYSMGRMACFRGDPSKADPIPSRVASSLLLVIHAGGFSIVVMLWLSRPVRQVRFLWPAPPLLQRAQEDAPNRSGGER